MNDLLSVAAALRIRCQQTGAEPRLFRDPPQAEEGGAMWVSTGALWRSAPPGRENLDRIYRINRIDSPELFIL